MGTVVCPGCGERAVVSESGGGEPLRCKCGRRLDVLPALQGGAWPTWTTVALIALAVVLAAVLTAAALALCAG